ncbi:MAG: MGMT family protein [Candidatus Pacearchaeota archaeon]
MKKFQKKDKLRKLIYEEVKKIPKGKIKTYKELALKFNTHPRIIGIILRENYNKKIPCHRVIKCNYHVGGYNRGINKKIKLLRKEGIKINKKGNIIFNS